jgi:hypothetical protein
MNSSPRKNISPRKRKQKPTTSETIATSIAICHQINSLFRAQPSFVEAELLANEFYKQTAVNNLAVHKKQTHLVPLLEALLNIMEASGNMAHVPCEVLANLALDSGYKRLIIQSDAVAITRALLLASSRQKMGSEDTTNNNTTLLLKTIAEDLMEDLQCNS